MPSRNARSIARHSRDQFVWLHPTPSSLRPRTHTHARTHTRRRTHKHTDTHARAHTHTQPTAACLRRTRNKQVRERRVRPTKETFLSTMNKACTICTRHFSQGTHFFFLPSLQGAESGQRKEIALKARAIYRGRFLSWKWPLRSLLSPMPTRTRARSSDKRPSHFLLCTY